MIKKKKILKKNIYWHLTKFLLENIDKFYIIHVLKTIKLYQHEKLYK